MGVTKRIANLFEDLEAQAPEKLAKLLSHLECIIRGGVDIEPYEHIFDRLGITQRLGIYNAAEGMIGHQDLSITDGIRYKFLHTGIFEFAPPSSFETTGQYIS